MPYEGKITQPVDGTGVPTTFDANGTLGNIPSELDLYLVVDIAGDLWPKVRVGIAGLDWSGKVHEEAGRYTLALYVVGSEGAGDIQRWFERGQKYGEYPPFKTIRESMRLHSINLHRA